MILDGRRSNASQIVLGYLTAIANGLSRPSSIPRRRGRRARLAHRSRSPCATGSTPISIYVWFTVPSLLGTLGLLIALVVTGQSVARERELGTFDQLMVSPLRAMRS